jgi:hypothetical protein
MNKSELKNSVINYVLQCRCECGGFCFYRLEEPNGADTYFALATLNFLEFNFADEKTIVYLQNMQHLDGSYESIFSAFYAVNGLRLLRKTPKCDHSFYISRNIDQYKFDVHKLPAAMTCAFKRTFYLVSLYNDLTKEVDNAVCDGMIKFILQFADADNGFGIGRSSLSETALALNILQQLNYPLEKLQVDNFIRACEISTCGFTEIPGTSLSFIEHIHAGLAASSLAGYHPLYPDQCLAFILNCRNKTGGFSRTTHGGIATLENTFLAIEALMFLDLRYESIGNSTVSCFQQYKRAIAG